MRTLRSLLTNVSLDATKLEEALKAVPTSMLDADMETTIYFGYGPKDVQDVAGHMNTVVTEEQSIQVLNLLASRYNAVTGMSFRDIALAISEVLSVTA